MLRGLRKPRRRTCFNAPERPVEGDSETQTLFVVYYLSIFEVLCLVQHLHHSGSTTWRLAKGDTSPPGKPSTPGTATTCIRITFGPATGFGNAAAYTG